MRFESDDVEIIEWHEPEDPLAPARGCIIPLLLLAILVLSIILIIRLT